jgi:hypothetical protein
VVCRCIEIANHLGNVLATLSDRKTATGASGTPVTHFLPIIQTANDYYPFGMVMPGRNYTTPASGNKPYKYGFNGQERSLEIDPNGNSNMAEFWQYDARLGRRWNVDPESVEYESPYAVNRNNPIVMSDPDGDWPIFGFIVGFIVEAVIQTVEIAVGIRKSYNVKEMVISGFASALGIQGSKYISRIRNITKRSKNLLNLGKDIAINAGEQYAKTGKVNIKDAIINAGASKIVGDNFEAQVKKHGIKYPSLSAKSAHKEARAKKSPNPKRVAEAKKATNAANGYVLDEALPGSVAGTSVATRTFDALTKKPDDVAKDEGVQNTDLNTKQGTINSAVQVSNQPAMPRISGLSRYISDIRKRFGNRIESISYSSIDNNSVGVNIVWKGDGSSSVTFDNRYSNHQLPAPPPPVKKD